MTTWWAYVVSIFVLTIYHNSNISHHLAPQFIATSLFSLVLVACGSLGRRPTLRLPSLRQIMRGDRRCCSARRRPHFEVSHSERKGKDARDPSGWRSPSRLFRALSGSQLQNRRVVRPWINMWWSPAVTATVGLFTFQRPAFFLRRCLWMCVYNLEPLALFCTFEMRPRIFGSCACLPQEKLCFETSKRIFSFFVFAHVWGGDFCFFLTEKLFRFLSHENPSSIVWTRKE